MNLKLIVAAVNDANTEEVLNAAREAGATGFTVLPGAKGEGADPKKTFFGLSLALPRDVIFLLVEENLSRTILESMAAAGNFDDDPGTGIAFQLDVEDAVGVAHQAAEMSAALNRAENAG